MSAAASGLSFARIVSDSGGNPACVERVEPFLRPRDVLKHPDGEPAGIDVDHDW